MGLFPPINQPQVDTRLPKRDEAPPTMENRREAMMRQKIRSQALRTKERNLAERRFLDRKLEAMRVRKRVTDSLIEKEVKDLRNSLRRQALLEQDNSDDEPENESQALSDEDDGSVSLPSIDSQGQDTDYTRRQSKVTYAIARHSRGGDDASRTRSAPDMSMTSHAIPRPSRTAGNDTHRWRRGAWRPHDYPACRFSHPARCRHFPCLTPSTYTSLGYEVDRTSGGARRDAVSTAQLVSAAHRERLLADLENTSVRRPKRSSLDQCAQKEHSLRKIIAEMKTRSEASRPPDWCTNYGTPTPHRKLFKVIRPSAGSADLAGL